MNMRRTILIAASHAAVGAAGFAAGIYAMLIIIAPAAPSAEEIREWPPRIRTVFPGS